MGACQDWEMDHICFRVGTAKQYRSVLASLVPSLGSIVVECMIGGRPVATVKLHSPIEAPVGSRTLRVPAVEIPAPKPGRNYTSGLEHAEIAIGSPADGISGDALLTRFIEAQPASLKTRFDLRHAKKGLNPDVSLKFGGSSKDDPEREVKFHARPLLEVAEREIAEKLAVPVPSDYWDCASERTG